MDSCDILETGRFDKQNILSRQNEALVLHRRADIRCKLSQLVESKDVPSCYERDKLDLVKYENLEAKEPLLEGALEGATYVSLEDSVKMHKSEEQCSKLPFVPSWPLSLFSCCASVSNYGFKPPSLPPFRFAKDLRLPWILLSLATSIPALWECIAKSVTYEGQATWPGWLLSFASKNVLQGYNSKKKHSQKNSNLYQRLLKPLELCWKMECGDLQNNEPAGGFKEYRPMFSFDKVIQCLSGLKDVEVFSRLESLTDCILENGINDSIQVIGLVGLPEDDDSLQDRNLPSSFMVRFLLLVVLLSLMFLFNSLLLISLFTMFLLFYFRFTMIKEEVLYLN
jgi:hypothetical protein